MCEVTEYINYQTGEKLDLERVSQLKDNAMLFVRPDLWCEWDFEKNNELGFDVWKMTKGSEKRAWWKCNKCKETKQYIIGNKTRLKRICACEPIDIPYEQSLEYNYPLISREFDVETNKTKPKDIHCNSGKLYWWKCNNFENHKWKTDVYGRTNSNRGCPYCSGNKLLVGFNDMWTTNPELAKLLANPEDGYKYMQSVANKVDWKCPDCGEILKNKKIDNIKKRGLTCPECSDGFSYPEKVMNYVLKQLKIDVDWSYTPSWSNKKRYDFYIPSLNVLIETHGMQHYKQGFASIGKRSLKEEQVNDKYKYELAIANGIKPENYIVIDCRYSELNYLKNSILNSRLAEIFDLNNVDWKKVGINSSKQIQKVCVDYWNLGVTRTVEIGRLLGITSASVNKYLKNANISGECEYTGSVKISKNIIQLSLNYEYIKKWNSANEIVKNLNLKTNTGIYQCCNNIRYKANGYKWMYEDDYENYINQKENAQ